MYGGAAEEAWQPPSNAHTCSHVKKDLSGAKTTEKVLDHVSDIGRRSHSQAHAASRFLSHSLNPTPPLSHSLPFPISPPLTPSLQAALNMRPSCLSSPRNIFRYPLMSVWLTYVCMCVCWCWCCGYTHTHSHTPLAAGNPHVDHGI